ncbi:hypothetical protein [Gryllotalpicola protaetiae]|uniref:Uncharacterized protein n=1 Tax=Gryllotalpicola protaetiae TaxID=2419771 RepID=A0A387BP82_9MICO|nr:hypothetical protein [Gryllotalpicola protaetiae]AYG05553.1 hypothetical protein D7I44_17910 [Gryllotalpicola protaetiae]
MDVDEQHQPRWSVRRFPVPVDQMDDGQAVEVGAANCPRCLVPAEPHEVFDALVCPACGQLVDAAGSAQADLLTDAAPANVAPIQRPSSGIPD